MVLQCSEWSCHDDATAPFARVRMQRPGEHDVVLMVAHEAALDLADAQKRRPRPDSLAQSTILTLWIQISMIMCRVKPLAAPVTRSRKRCQCRDITKPKDEGDGMGYLELLWALLQSSTVDMPRWHRTHHFSRLNELTGHVI